MDNCVKYIFIVQNPFSSSFYTRNICYIIMEMVSIPEIEETLQSWKKKKQKPKKKELDEKEKSEK